mmetsp:Transcript_42475/g.102316  ORF Transcript_42475/g.102316 Transcript_42475/m.102316 type:complete len:501 (+) Transcript_42475:370-1872(+)
MLSEAQYYTLIGVSMFSSTLSMASSSIIVISASRKPSSSSSTSGTSNRSNNHNNSNKSVSVYQRILLAMSLTDVIGSFFFLLHPFLLPRYTRELGMRLASGNSATCTLAGFFLVLCPLLVTFLSLWLSLYFYMKVKYNKQERDMVKLFRHLVSASVLVCLGLAISGLVVPQGYAPRTYHNVCTFGDCVMGKVDECDVETGASWYLGWVNVVLFVLPAVAALGLTAGLYCTVKKKLAATRQFSFVDQNTQQQQDLLKATRNQATLYALAYWNSFFWYFLYGMTGGDDPTVIDQEGEVPYLFAVQVLVWFFFPLQGFVNLVVYSRPRYLQWRKMYVQEGRWFAFRKAVSLQPVSATAQIRRRDTPVTDEMNVTDPSSSQSNLRNGGGSFLKSFRSSIKRKSRSSSVKKRDDRISNDQAATARGDDGDENTDNNHASFTNSSTRADRTNHQDDDVEMMINQDRNQSKDEAVSSVVAQNQIPEGIDDGDNGGKPDSDDDDNDEE